MKLQLKVPDMSCSGCVNAITNAIKTVDVNASIQGDPKTKIVLVETESSESAIKTAIACCGDEIRGGDLFLEVKGKVAIVFGEVKGKVAIAIILIRDY